MWLIYILRCKDGSLYTGMTNNLKKRFTDHQSGRGGRYTRSHKVVKILYTEQCTSRGDALKRESAIKKLARHKKLSLIRQHKILKV